MCLYFRTKLSSLNIGSYLLVACAAKANILILIIGTLIVAWSSLVATALSLRVIWLLLGRIMMYCLHFVSS